MDERLDLITAWTDQLADLVDAAPTAEVAACPGWTLHDLGLHLLEVHAFWTFIIESRPAGPDGYDASDAPSSGELGAALRAQVRELARALRSADPTDEARSWAVEQTVGFTVRRQTHEALIHLFDAVLAVEGTPTPPVPTDVAADGVAEMFDVMLGGLPPSWTFAPDGVTFRIEATDAARSWTLGFGQFAGVTSDGRELQGTAVAPASTDSPDVAISGAALDLDLWLWGRAGTDALNIAGDAAVAARLRSLAADSLS